MQAGDRDKIDRDEPDPETFNIRRNRDPSKILGFGYGPHRCQGEALSKIELEIAFATLFGRLPSLKLAKSPEKLKYSPAVQNAGVLELPVTFDT